MKYCKRCLYPETHPLNITFDKDGVCSGCRVHEEKFTLDWKDREQKLIKILNDYKSKDGSNYDCIIPVTGARDSYFIVHMVKKVYGLNPLLVMYNKHYNTRRGLRNFAYLKTLFDCDALSMVVDPHKLRRITDETIKKCGSMYWHVLAGQTVFPVQIAVRHKIPLIIWGAHQGLDQVGMFSHTDEVEMTRKYRKEHDLMGFEAEDLLKDSNLTEGDVSPFIYPHDKELEKIGIRGIYLGNYIPWDSKKQHELMIKLYGYETAEQQRTFDTYNDVDCIHYSGMHDYIKYIKHGYGKVTDHACREIRWGRLTRDEGIELVKTYQEKNAPDISQFLKWMGLKSGEGIFKEINKHRNPNVWSSDTYIGWRHKDPVTNYVGEKGIEYLGIPKTDNCEFLITPSKEPLANEKEYVLMTKGFVG